MNRTYVNCAHKLIYSYIAQATSLCQLLKDRFQLKDTLLRSKVTKQIPKEGSIDDVYYNFHGIGCYFEFKDGSIDIDFGPDEAHIGFDQYRLYEFLSHMNDLEKNEYKDILDQEAFSVQFIQLEELGIVNNPKDPVSSHLYYLT